MTINVNMVGNVGKKPELRKTQSGTSVTEFSVASNNVYTDKEGNRQEKTNWQLVTAWGKQAENCAQYLEKGSKVSINGELENSSYEKDGVTRYKSALVVSKIEFLSKGRETPAQNFLNNLEAATDKNASFIKEGDRVEGTLQGVVNLDGKPHQILDTGKQFVVFPEVPELAVHRHEKASLSMEGGKISAQLIKQKDEPWKGQQPASGLER